MSQKLGFENSLLTFDAFSAHKTDEVEAKLVQNKSDILMTLAGCTSKCQPWMSLLTSRLKPISENVGWGM